MKIHIFRLVIMEVIMFAITICCSLCLRMVPEFTYFDSNRLLIISYTVFITINFSLVKRFGTIITVNMDSDRRRDVKSQLARHIYISCGLQLAASLFIFMYIADSQNIWISSILLIAALIINIIHFSIHWGYIGDGNKYYRG